MRRPGRVLPGALASLLLSVPGAFAQTAENIYRLGVLSPSAGTVERGRTVLLPELARRGFVEGRNLVVEARSGATGQLPALARELAATRPTAVLGVGSAAIRALRQEAAPTPIVGAFIGDDPIVAGFAKSLSRPGGSVTGIVMLAPELDAKRLDLLHQALPGARRIGALTVSAERGAASIAAMREVARPAGLEIVSFSAAGPDAYPAVFAAMHNAGIDALEITSAPEFFTDAQTLAARAIEAKLPTMCEWRSMAADGCLIGYGPNFTELQLRVADYVARIFQGAAPGDLPIEEPTRFELAVNLKTAKTLDLPVPPSILARADEVIE